MDDAADGTERDRARLDELVDLGMALARDLQGRALAAEDDGVAAELALAFHRISRSVRQTMALDARLERERRQVLQEDARAQARKTLERVQRRRSEVRDALAPLIWTEAEGDEDEAEALFEALEHQLMAYGPEDGAFADQPLDLCIEAICAKLGLGAADAANTPDYDEPDEAVIRQGSG